MGRGRKQTGPYTNLIYNPKGFILIGQAPFGATNRTREEKGASRLTIIEAKGPYKRAKRLPDCPRPGGGALAPTERECLLRTNTCCDSA